MTRAWVLALLCGLALTVTVSSTETMFIEEPEHDAEHGMRHLEHQERSFRFLEARITQSADNSDDVTPSAVMRLYYTISSGMSLTLEKLKAWMASRGSDATNTEAWFKSIDTNNDGSISLQEFLAYFFPSAFGGEAPAPAPRPTSAPAPAPRPTAAPAPRPTAAPAPSPSAPQLKPSDVSFEPTANGQLHNTQEFLQYQLTSDLAINADSTRLVVRRGFAFEIRINTMGSFVAMPTLFKFWAEDEAFTVGPDAAADVTKWRARYRGTVGNSLSFELFPPHQARVGYYRLSIQAPGQGKIVPLGRIIVLFNPFNSMDDVYMADKAGARFYTMAPVGFVYYGDALNGGRAGIGGMAWSYHQYEVLDEVLRLFDKKYNPDVPKDVLVSPVPASRYLSWMLNNVGNKKGVLGGRWDGNYADGVAPTTWTGSREIYAQHAKTSSPVKYGQCWVFGGILTSALRALGIPARTITNFRSAHDQAPYDMVIDTSAGESIWNFHVWVDAWMARDDLGQKHAWNAVDATPQEEDDGKYQTGPASLSDIYNKRNSSKFNVKFIAGEVDAAVWRGTGKYREGASPADFDIEDVGRLISAGKVGCTTSQQYCWEDITKQYKRPTGMRFAGKQHMFSAELNPARPTVGEGFNITLLRSHVKLEEATKVRVIAKVEQTLYTGDVLGVLKETSTVCVMTADPDSTENTCKENSKGWTLHVDPIDYLDLLAIGESFRVSIKVEPLGYGSLKMTDGLDKQFFYWEKQFMLISPAVKVTTEPANIVAGQPYVAYVQFNNPFSDATLNNLAMVIDTPDFDRKAKFANQVVKPGAAVILKTRPIVTTTPGTHKLVIALNTKELSHLYGSLDIKVSAGSAENEVAAASFSSQSGSSSSGASFASSSFYSSESSSGSSTSASLSSHSGSSSSSF